MFGSFRRLEVGKCFVPIRHMDPTTFTVATLRIVARSNGLSIAGNKAELIRRLQEFDPADEWMQQAELEQRGDGASNGRGDDHGSVIDTNERDKEMDLMRREYELIN